MAGQKKFDSFREAMAGVKPLSKAPERIPPAAPPSTAARPRSSSGKTFPPLVPLVSGERIESLAVGADPALLRDLKQGKYRPQAELDAHGLSAEATSAAVSRLLQHAKDRSCQTLLIIHGRGLHSGPEGPVLRDEIVERLCLRHAADVLAFCSAPSQWGGSGALLVQLRRQRRANRLT